MTARLLLGRPVADEVWKSVTDRLPRIEKELGRAPCLGIVDSADDAALAYARQIERAFSRNGFRVIRQAPLGTQSELLATATSLRENADVDGVVFMTPLAPGLDVRAGVQALGAMKDVDGQHPANLGGLVAQGIETGSVPSTPLGGVRLLEHYGIPIAGARAVVVGRSLIVGLPLALLLIARHATVTVCHSRTTNLNDVTRTGDILCVAAGRPGLIGPSAVKRGAVVLDFGTNPTSEGGLVGDVDTRTVSEQAEAVTPVPGGTGPVTVAILAQQTLTAAARSLPD